MSTVQELKSCDRWLYGKLSVDAQLVTLTGGTGGVARVYSELAPEGTNPPFVLMTFLSAVDLTAVGAVGRIYVRPLYLIRAYTTETTMAGVASQIADRVEALVVGASGTQDGITVGVWWRKEAVRGVEVVNGVRFSWAGGRYQTMLTGLS